MIKNYLRVAFRSLLKNKTYVIINTLGLGVSLACCITAYLLMAYNIEFDSFHDSKKVSNIYKFYTMSHEKDGKEARDDGAPMVLAPIASEEIAGIRRYARYIPGNGSLRYKDNAFNESIAFADSTFFEMFDFPLSTGSHKSFRDKKTIFISEKLARKYFGEEDPMGKLMVGTFVNGTEIEVLVGGILKKVPVNNTFTFDAMMRIENYMDIHLIGLDNWAHWRTPSTFFELASPEQAGSISAQFGKYIPNRNKLQTDMVVESYQLVPFKSNYSWDEIRNGWVNHRMAVVPLILFASMAGLILLIACFNLTNTSIAITARRLKEVGVRKAIGAGRRQIASQFLLETLVSIVLSMLVGWGLAQFIVPAFYTMWELPYGLEDLNGLNLFIAIVFLVFMSALLAGVYPAVSSSKFQPTLLLKGNVGLKGTNLLTRTLVAFQFALSIVMLIAGVVFLQNSGFQERIQFGYDKDMVVTVNLQGESDYRAMEAAISRNPKILSIAVSDGNISSNTYSVPVTVDTSQYETTALGVGKNYFETLGLKFSEGRAFNPDNASDQEEGIVVNKEFVHRTGLKEPLDKIIILHNVRRRILGVIENHVDNLYRSKKYEPFVFYPAAKNQYALLLVRAERTDLQETQRYLQATWKSLFPTKPFESQFQEDFVLKDSKTTNSNLERIFLFITVLGGLLSAWGIFALASLNISKRTKEIGIRKVLGATVAHIVGLLNREFLIILSFAAVGGSVGGYFLTNRVLDEYYAYHVPVEIPAVVLCAALIFAMGILTTSSTILRAARSNPVKALKTE